jgi:hypothetical protein
LTPDQYDSLFNIVPRAETKAEMESYLHRFADKWQLRVAIDGVLYETPTSSVPAANPSKP